MGNPSIAEMRIAVIVSDGGQAAHLSGGSCEISARTFPMSKEIADYVREIRKNSYANINLAIAEEKTEFRP
jgi:hypothetical protein